MITAKDWRYISAPTASETDVVSLFKPRLGWKGEMVVYFSYRNEY